MNTLDQLKQAAGDAFGCWRVEERILQQAGFADWPEQVKFERYAAAKRDEAFAAWEAEKKKPKEEEIAPCPKCGKNMFWSMYDDNLVCLICTGENCVVKAKIPGPRPRAIAAWNIMCAALKSE